jgi:hypothetical protein
MRLAKFGDWRGRSVEVTARLIPRYLWTTASIDVYIDSECVLRTGGQMKSVGTATDEFYASGSIHTVELTWGRPGIGSFPVTIAIDDEFVADSRVCVENWPIGLWPFITLPIAAWAFWLLR